MSYAFLSGAELAKRIARNIRVYGRDSRGVCPFAKRGTASRANLCILIGFGDFVIGISLSLGLFTRLGGMLAILRAVINILVAGGAGPDTVGFNAMLIAAGAIGLTTRAGRRFGLDRLLLARWPTAKLLRLVA